LEHVSAENDIKNNITTVKHMLEKLGNALVGIPVGPIPEDKADAILAILADGWAEFEGSNKEEMKPVKILRDCLTWNPPVLEVSLRRCCANCMGKGSILEGWGVEVETEQPLVEETVKPVQSRSQSQTLKWRKDKGPKETVRNRRKRLSKSLEKKS